MNKPSTKMIAIHLERREAAACRAFERASEQAEARILAAVEGIRPFREKLGQARSERAAFLAEQTVEDTAAPDVESANASLSALALSLDTAVSEEDFKGKNTRT
jgi:hypothetical protein